MGVHSVTVEPQGEQSPVPGNKPLLRYRFAEGLEDAWQGALKDIPKSDFTKYILGSPPPEPRYLPPQSLLDEVERARAVRRGTVEMEIPATHAATVRPRRATDKVEGRDRWIVERHAVTEFFPGYTVGGLVDLRCYRTRRAARQAARDWRGR